MEKIRPTILALLFGVLGLAHGAHALDLDRPVVLELFTSQGCSSCPPADAILTTLSKKDSVIALSYHVDYWDYIGWKDQHALPISTVRQQAYAQRLNLRYVYTPQLVVNGVAQTVGSKLPEIQNCIAEAKDSPRVNIERSAESVVEVTRPENLASDSQSLDVLLVSYTPWSKSNIKRGENRGRQLGYTNSVKSVQKVGALEGSAGSFRLPAIKTDGAVLLVQTTGHGPIHGALRLK